MTEKTQTDEEKVKELDASRRGILFSLWKQLHGEPWVCALCEFVCPSFADVVAHFTDNDQHIGDWTRPWCRGIDPSLEPLMLTEPWQGPVELSPAYLAWLYTSVARSPEWFDGERLAGA